MMFNTSMLKDIITYFGNNVQLLGQLPDVTVCSVSIAVTSIVGCVWIPLGMYSMKSVTHRILDNSALRYREYTLRINF